MGATGADVVVEDRRTHLKTQRLPERKQTMGGADGLVVAGIVAAALAAVAVTADAPATAADSMVGEVSAVSMRSHQVRLTRRRRRRRRP